MFIPHRALAKGKELPSDHHLPCTPRRGSLGNRDKPLDKGRDLKEEVGGHEPLSSRSFHPCDPCTEVNLQPAGEDRRQREAKNTTVCSRSVFSSVYCVRVRIEVRNPTRLIVPLASCTELILDAMGF